MGADLFVAVMSAPHQEGVKPWDIDRAVAERIGHERIDAYDLDGLTDDDLETLGMNLGIRPWDAEDAEALTPEAARAGLAADIREALHGALTEVFGQRRDMAELGLGGRDYWVSGGMSGGDAPTDAYEWIAALDWIGVYEEPLPAPSEGDESVGGE